MSNMGEKWPVNRKLDSVLSPRIVLLSWLSFQIFLTLFFFFFHLFYLYQILIFNTKTRWLLNFAPRTAHSGKVFQADNAESENHGRIRVLVVDLLQISPFQPPRQPSPPPPPSPYSGK